LLSVGSYAQHTALVFPTGGYHWPGMGEDFAASEAHSSTIARAEEALRSVGVAPGALRHLMRGETQIRRALTDTGWQWFGDFPLTMAAQTAVSQVLAEAFLQAWGPPALVVGESMGECAACCVVGALSVEQAVLVAYRWGRALAQASDRLGLRMAVVEDLEPAQLAQLAEPLQAKVVVDESRTLVVVSVPVSNLQALQDAAAGMGGSVLVSSNACVAHDPRLRVCGDIWREYDAFLRELTIEQPRLPILSALHPGRRLETSEQVRTDLIETTSSQVRWRETVALLPSLGVRNLVQPCAPMKAYALEKLRSEEECLQGVRVQTARTLEGIQRLGRQRNSTPPSAK
jgi:malonyl CoA-acyl carrier protein transacylase